MHIGNFGYHNGFGVLELNQCLTNYGKVSRPGDGRVGTGL